MAKDDYQYQSWPLPKVSPWGGSPESNANIPQLDASNYPTASSLSVPSPFDNPAVGGGGGGTPTALHYITDATNVILGVGPDGTADSAQVIGTNRARVDSGSGDTFVHLDGIDLATSVAMFQLGANVFQLSVKDYNDITGITGQVKLRRLDVCHLGAPGFRGFLASESFPPSP